MPGGKMKLDEDLGPDRGDDFQTDDEENQAERVFEHLGDDTESDKTPPSPSFSHEDFVSPSWPQSYRQSMNMLTSVTPNGFDLIRRISSLGRIDSSTLAFKRFQENQDDSSLSTPLVTETNSLKQEDHVAASTPHTQSLASSSELPPPKEQCSFAQSVMNGINILCGIGILTIPYALKEGGWLSLTLLLMFAIICCYTGILLKRCIENQIGLNTYPDIGQAAFGIAGRLGIAVSAIGIAISKYQTITSLRNIFLYLELFASCVEYIILVSDNLSSLFPNAHMRFGGTDFDTAQIFAITAAVLVLPTVWLRNLSLLSYISVGGIFATVLVALCLFWIGTVDQVVGFKPSGNLLDLENISVSVGLYSFCFAGHAVFPNIYTSMKEPSKFSSVLYVSFAFCLVMYVSVGTVGYLTFGDSVASQFTLNMPKELYASKIATWTTAVTPLTKYALTLLPIALSIEELVPSRRLRCHATSVLVRTTLVILSLLVALYIPYFGSLMALIGSVMSTIVALIYPCACYLKLHSGRISKAEIINCILIIIVGLVSSFVGTYSAISKITGAGD